MRRLWAIVCAWSGHDDHPSGRTIRSSKNWGPGHYAPIVIEYWDCRRCGARSTRESWQWEAEYIRTFRGAA